MRDVVWGRQGSLAAVVARLVVALHYLALAAHLGDEFWTTDRRMVNTVQAALSWVRLVGA